MPKRQAIITSVTIQGLTQTETARLYQVSQATVSRLINRYKTHGDTAFQPQSRKPKNSPTQIPQTTTNLILKLRTSLTNQGLDAGPATIQWHLKHHHNQDASISTIRRRLVAANLITPNPKKRPKTSYTRFEADQPNETWQSDFTHIRLANNTDTETITWLDDHSRYALHMSAHPRVTGQIVVDTFQQTAAKHGLPASTLTDNGLVYTTRLAGGQGGLNGFERLLADLNITQKNSKPRHPTTCGKVERYQQTVKKWVTAQRRAETIPELQNQLNEFVEIYNNQRPHRALDRRTPATAYALLPKAEPMVSEGNQHHRVRHDIVGSTGKVTLRHAGKLHHIWVGRAHGRTPVVLLVQDLDIRVVSTGTGELLRQLVLDPTRDYQPKPKTTQGPNP